MNDIVPTEIETTQGMIDDLAKVTHIYLKRELAECSMEAYDISMAAGFDEIEDLETAIGKAVVNELIYRAIAAKMEHEQSKSQ